MNNRTVIVTDLDGTLLDADTYSFDAAGEALALVRNRKIPLVISSSKTRAEIEACRRLLGNTDPFIAENGGAVYVPQQYFGFSTSVNLENGYEVTVLGTPYAMLREVFKEANMKTGAGARGFGDMTAAEVAALTGLGPVEAELARQRGYDEPFVLEGSVDINKAFLDFMADAGFRWTKGGRFYHLHGENDKGAALKVLKGFYVREYGSVRVIALGDSPNDEPLLSGADIAVLVEKPGGGHDAAITLPGLVRARGAGPVGWNSAVMRLVGDEKTT